MTPETGGALDEALVARADRLKSVLKLRKIQPRDPAGRRMTAQSAGLSVRA